MSTTLLSAVSSRVNSTGYLTQVVDPDDFINMGSQSPEGQSFVILAYAAYNEWVALGRQGEKGSNPLGPSSTAERRSRVGSMGLLGVDIVSALTLMFGVVLAMY